MVGSSCYWAMEGESCLAAVHHCCFHCYTPVGSLVAAGEVHVRFYRLQHCHTAMVFFYGDTRSAALLCPPPKQPKLNVRLHRKMGVEILRCNQPLVPARTVLQRLINPIILNAYVRHRHLAPLCSRTIS